MAADRYTVEHETRYIYGTAVSQSWQLARLTPRNLPWQKLLSCAIEIEPRPDERHDAPDAFGNTVTHFGLQGAHRLLRVRMACSVEVGARPQPEDTPFQRWEDVRDVVRGVTPGLPPLEDLSAALLAEPSTLVPLSEGARAYAAPSFAPGRDWLEAITELMQRIHADFAFETGVTTVSTSVDEVLELRSGVCQDFAHVMLACLRAHGLPGRYVSGYLLTDPPPGQARLMGADASHAWVAAYSPACGWVEFDPTNNQLADTRHITLGWGSDFADVAPLRGVILGGAGQQLDTWVSVIPVE
jgi:transglutaminase-like putative cysteine protease